MNEIMEKIFNATLGSPFKFVTNETKSKGLRNFVFGTITTFGFFAMFALLYVATLFGNIFAWVFFIAFAIVILDTTFNFIKKFIEYNAKNKALKNEEN